MFDRLQLYVPTSPADAARRTAARVGFCAVPYLLAAHAAEHFGDGRLLRSPAYGFCVFVVPGAGLALDLWRLRRTARPEGPT